MPLNQTAIKVGTAFIDTALSSQPSEYRLHIVRSITDTHLAAEHISSGNMRTFPIDKLKALTPVPGYPDAESNLDCLVGRTVAMALVNGTRVVGVVTAVRYHEVPITLAGDDATEPSRQVRTIELDRSGSTEYQWAEIQTIQEQS